MELSDRLLKFLGKAENDPDLLEFLTEFKPDFRVSSYKHIKGYNFDKLGFRLSYDSSLGGITSVAFHIFTRAVRDGDFKPYAKLLPFGIAASDSRAEVQSKMGVEPARSTPYEGYPSKVCNPCEDHATWWDTYIIPPMRIGVIFRSPLSDIDLFGVHYLPLLEALETTMGPNENEESAVRKESGLQAPNFNRRRRSASLPHRHSKDNGN